MIEITTEKLPIKMWLNDIEDGAMEQVKNLANLPFAFMNIAIMPDAHEGFGMPIGGVLATKDYMIPDAVGTDIGCGMRSVKTSLTEIDRDGLIKIMKCIRENIPVGFNHNREKHAEDMPNILIDKEHMPITNHEFNDACFQVGTLGGGNHFIEIQKGADGHIWIMLHSGSRNIGLKVADYYNKLAKEMNKKYYSSIPEKWDLAFLPIDSEEGRNYQDEMNYCLEFAKCNRKRMMNIIKEGFTNNFRDITFEEDLDIHHNYASFEKHFGRSVIVHRKGATSAKKDELGIIPGSQGTSSYIVKGKGNMFSFNSCSHGAGRKMGRNDARRTLNLADQIKLLTDRGIIHSVRTVADLDEAPGAYKDIDEVMANQTDLVEIVMKLEPLAVIKG